ncbi:unnamed protein product, partial [Polarella glacialis]
AAAAAAVATSASARFSCYIAASPTAARAVSSIATPVELRSPTLPSGQTSTKQGVAWTTPCAIYGDRFEQGRIPEGLSYCPDFVTEAEEAELDEMMKQGPWMRHIKSRAQQFFGLVYYQTSHEVPALQPGSEEAQLGRPLDDLPPWLLPRVLDTGTFPREGEINQVAANEYIGTAGISSHVEDPIAFGANLATVSLLAPIQLTLTPVEEDLHGRDGLDHGNWIKVLLEPRSLLVLQGDSRYRFRHGIRRSKNVTLASGAPLSRKEGYRRVSLTFRELLETRRKLPFSEV